MRHDMSKVVTERPRRGSSAKSKKTARRLTVDEVAAAYDDTFDSGPKRSKVSRHGQYGWNSKEFSDLLGPLRGYLKKQVGRPWNKVFSELSAHLDRRSTSGSHIWDHVFMEVETKAWLGVDGKVYVSRKYTNTVIPVAGLYVHPRTGILRWAKEIPFDKTKTWWYREAQEKAAKEAAAKVKAAHDASLPPRRYDRIDRTPKAHA